MNSRDIKLSRNGYRINIFIRTSRVYHYIGAFTDCVIIVIRLGGGVELVLDLLSDVRASNTCIIHAEQSSGLASLKSSKHLYSKKNNSKQRFPKIY